MNAATTEMFNDLLATAKILVDASGSFTWDLAHYIADVAIAKIMMLKLHEEKDYPKDEVERYNFPELINQFRQHFHSIDLDYREIKKQHSLGRNTFQHKLITNYLGIRQPQARLYIQILHDMLEQFDILNPKPDFSIGSKISLQEHQLNYEEEIKFFIKKLLDKDYESLLNRFYDDRFKEIFKKLFTKISMDTGHLELYSSSFILTLGVEKIYAIQPLFKMKEKYKVGWDNLSTAERIQIFLGDFEDRVKMIFGFEILDEE